MITKTTVYGSSGILLSDANDFVENPIRHQIQVGQVKMGEFRLISRYISETVQDRDKVTASRK